MNDNNSSSELQESIKPPENSTYYPNKDHNSLRRDTILKKDTIPDNKYGHFAFRYFFI